MGKNTIEKIYDQNKIYKDLYSKSKANINFKQLIKLIENEENIILAYHNIRNNKGSKTPGMDGRTIEDIDKLSREELITVMRSKLDKYEKSLVKRVYIPKANGKERPLGIPNIADRILQQAILQILNPIFEAKFDVTSHGFRKGRGTQTALSQCYRILQVQKAYHVVSIDLKDYFNTVNHRKLRQLLWNNGIKDKKLLSIINEMLKTPIYDKGVITKSDKGVPQGGVLSPLLSNVVLHELDKWLNSQWRDFPTRKDYVRDMVNREGKPILSNKYRALRTTELKEIYNVRYADDFLIFTKSYDEAKRIYEATHKWLNEELKLEVNEEKSQIIDARYKPFNYLGYKIRLVKKCNTYRVKSNVSEQSFEKIKNKSVELIDDIKKNRHNRTKMINSIKKYNVITLGWHEYYKYATHVNKDFAKIRQSNYFKIRHSLKNVISKKEKVNNVLLDKYNPKEIVYVCGYGMIPIGDISTVNPKDNSKNYYELLEIEENIDINSLLKRINIATYTEYGIEFSENRLKKFIHQKGKCYITKKDLYFEEIHCHHIKPKEKGGDDKYTNLVILSKEVHKLIHMTDTEKIKYSINILELKTDEINRLNKLRDLIGLKPVEK